MPQGTIRIIGGKWRGRRLPVPKVMAVRPTPDRVRETVFNWLASYVNGAICLDAFSGSGALGFEALSRGAAHVTFVDANKKIIQQLQKTVALLQVNTTKIIQAKFPQQFIEPQKFDIVFLDPPFGKKLISPSVNFLQEYNLLNKDALLYVETEANLGDIKLSESWSLLKHKTTGEVAYSLFLCSM